MSPSVQARPLLAFIRLQQNPRPRRRGRRMASLGKHLLQLLALGFRQADYVTGHGFGLQTRGKAGMTTQSLRSVNLKRLGH